MIIEQEAAAAARRARRVDRRRAHRARAQAGRRSRAGDGVPLQAHAARRPNFHVNLTCLVPTENPEVGAPAAARPQGDAAPLPRLPLRGRHARASSSSSPSCKRRIHILEGFATIFDALDEAIRIIRKSRRQGGRRREADEALQARRRAGRRDPRAEALQAGAARDPASSRRSSRRSAAEAKRHRGAPRRASASCWDVVRDELAEVAEALRRQAPHQDRRRGATSPSSTPRPSSSTRTPRSILTRDGWVKRVREVKDLVGDAPARGRRGAGRASRGSTKEPVAFFSNFGSCLRHAASTTSRRRPATASRCRSSSSSTTASASSARCRSTRGGRARGDAGLARHASSGFGLRFALDAAPRAVDPRRPPLRQAGRGRRDRRRASRAATATSSCVVDARRRTRSLCKADEIPELADPGRGVTVIKVDDDDAVIGFVVGRARSDALVARDRQERQEVRRSRPIRTQVTGARRQGPPARQARKIKVVRVEPPVTIAAACAERRGQTGVN